MATRQCPGCHIEKPLDEYSLQRGRKSGRQSRCKTCFAHYRATHKESIKKFNDAYRLQHREELIAYGKAWRARNPTKVMEYRRVRSLLHKESMRLKSREYEATHKAQRRAYNRQYYKSNLKRFRVYAKQYHKEHRHKWIEYRRRRRALQHQSAVIDFIDLDIVYKRDKGVCSLCSTKVERKEASLDHIIPLTKGGEHSYRNTALAHKRCNSRKYNNVMMQQMRLF